jgi:hypothetical protein
MRVIIGQSASLVRACSIVPRTTFRFLKGRAYHRLNMNDATKRSEQRPDVP